jgi:hypothetical protein
MSSVVMTAGVEKRFLKDGDPPVSTITKKSIDRFG